MKYRKKSIAVIIIFAVFVGSAYLIWPFLKGYLAGSNTENRTLVEFPKLTKETFSEYPSQLEAYVDDHLPFRSKMIELNSLIDYYVLNTSSNSGVTKGKDNWLFYSNKSDGDPMSDYTGRKLYTEDQLQTIARNMKMTKDNLAEQGIDFVLFLAPNRERVYPEYMPDYYGQPAENSDLKQVVDYLRANTDVKVVCPYEDLMAYKKDHPDQILYHMTDTHWNDLGGYIGAKDLFKAVGASWDDNKVKIQKVSDAPGDMADMLNLRDVIYTGETYTLSGFAHDDTKTMQPEVFTGHWQYSSPSAPNGSILVNRDSFCTAMSQYIKEAYKQSDMVHKAGFTNDLVESKKPEVYVLERVERSMDDLLTYSYNDLSYETDINKYLDKLNEDKNRYVVFMSAKDDASSALTPEIMEKLQKLGVQTDLQGKYKNGFYSVIDSGKNIAEDSGTEVVSRQSALDGLTYSIVSAGLDSGSASSIILNGAEYSKNSRGLNIVVYDKKYGTVIDSVAFDTCGDLSAVR